MVQEKKTTHADSVTEHSVLKPQPDHLQEKLRNLPPLPGIYLMKDRKGTILYIGKALSLKDRVRSYFQKGAIQDSRIATMVRQVADLEWIVTGSELEALILENTLVKKHKPRYNVILRDDKNYPFLRLPVKEPFPRITVVRRIKQDGALYFGPYVPVHAMRETLKVIKRVFPLATCTLDLEKRYDRACVEYEIKRCVAPCIRAVDREGYARVVREARLFLEGKDRELLSSMKKSMEEAAGRQDFEEAARLRDRIRHIEQVLERQRIVTAEMKDVDVLAMAREGDLASLQIFFFRGGVLTGRKDILYPHLKDTPDEEVFLSFIEQFYSREILIPEEIILPVSIAESRLLQDWLSSLRGGRVEIVVPMKGKKKSLINLALENATQALKGTIGRRKHTDLVLRDLQRLLSLSRVPDRIEAFDISNIQGVHAVGSMVVWQEGGMRKDAYRHFRIRTVPGADDFAMLQEVLHRRYSRLITSADPLPDLIVLDGGKGQLNAGLEVLRGMGVEDPAVIGMAKEKGAKEDRVFLPGIPDAVSLDPVSPATHVLQKIRDEAHRFAIQYHRKLRGKEALLSGLEDISGIGKIRKLALLRFFGSKEEIMKASLEEIQQVPKMTLKAAEEVWTAMHTVQSSPPHPGPPPQGGRGSRRLATPSPRRAGENHEVHRSGQGPKGRTRRSVSRVTVGGDRR